MSHDAEYVHLYRQMRSKIGTGQWVVGQQVPSLAELKREFGGPSATTIRNAQQMLVDEGMLRIERGRGAFVTAREPSGAIDIAAVLEQARAHLELAQYGLEAQQSQQVLIDLDDPTRPLTRRVLTEALTAWATDRRQTAEAFEDQAEAQEALAQAHEADQLTADIEAAVRG
ncbi:GntR family transcriptional regulator [Nesterenkonia sp. F]|uniref:winged helix-turn-helix domain-containing protein n=1 Tax=Nesterenkonia sp. F TaxID=795955 RepID=UPI000255C89F|nr:GntR family transcriptional regulator [Nesterenkonia sp. F]